MGGGYGNFNEDGNANSNSQVASEPRTQGEALRLSISDRAGVQLIDAIIAGDRNGDYRCGTLATPPVRFADIEIPGDETLTDIRDAANAYITQVDSGPSDQVRLLTILDKAIYKWFADNPSPSLDALEHGGILKELLAESEITHRNIIANNLADDEFVPIDTTDLDDEQVRAVKVLWRSIVDGTGRLRVVGDDDFRAETLAGIAKTLQTDIGRRMLDYLNNPPVQKEYDQVVEIVRELPEQFQHMEADHGSESSYAIAKGTLHAEGDDKPKFANHELKGRQEMNDEDAANFLHFDSPASVLDAVFDSKQGVSHDGQIYAFGEGSGAFVKMSAAAGNDGFSMMGTADNEVLRPRWITLAHELGHATKMRAGAMAGGAMGGRDLFEAVQNNATERGLWTNPEEWINISHIENAVRGEWGIHQRQYHKPLEVVRKRRRNDLLKQIYDEAIRLDEFALELSEIKDFDSARRQQVNQLDNNALFNDLWEDAQGLADIVRNSTSFLAAARRQVCENRIEEVVSTAGGPADFDKYIAISAEWRAIDARLTEAVTGSAGRNELYEIRKDIREFVASVPGIKKREKKTRRRNKWAQSKWNAKTWRRG